MHRCLMLAESTSHSSHEGILPELRINSAHHIVVARAGHGVAEVVDGYGFLDTDMLHSAEEFSVLQPWVSTPPIRKRQKPLDSVRLQHKSHHVECLGALEDDVLEDRHCRLREVVCIVATGDDVLPSDSQPFVTTLQKLLDTVAVCQASVVIFESAVEQPLLRCVQFCSCLCNTSFANTNTLL